MRAFVLHSGGIDSTTCLMMALKEVGVANTEAVSIDYGQRHRREIVASEAICLNLGVPHKILEIDLTDQPKSMLTDLSAAIPSIAYRDIKGVSPTYVDGRNSLLLSRLASYASACVRVFNYEHGVLYFGAHADDAAGGAYPDCTPEFVAAKSDEIRIGTYGLISLRAPLLTWMKDDIIRFGSKLEAPYELTWSCYAGGQQHCGVCPTCRARREGFSKAGVKDPTTYESEAA